MQWSAGTGAVYKHIFTNHALRSSVFLYVPCEFKVNHYPTIGRFPRFLFISHHHFIINKDPHHILLHSIISLLITEYSLQSLLSVGGISVMYKVQLLGPQNVLHKYEPFLLNPPICMLLYLGCTDEFPSLAFDSDKQHPPEHSLGSAKKLYKGCMNSAS